MTQTANQPVGVVRNPLLDASRLMAAVAILWMHTWQSGFIAQSGEIGRFAVPFFVMASMYLLVGSLRRDPQKAYLAYAKQRFVRLYLPFLGWAFLGWIAMFAKHRYFAHSAMEPLSPGDLLTGRSFQLWFLPFLLLVCWIAFPILKWIVALSARAQTVLGAVAFILAVLVAYTKLPLPSVGTDDPRFSYVYFAALSWDAIPSVFAGCGMAIILRSQVPRWLGVLGLAVTVVASAIVVVYGRNILLETLAGLMFLLFAICAWRNDIVYALAQFPFLVFGIYLSQAIVLETIQTGLNRLHVPHTSPVEVGVFLAALALCTGICFVLQSSRWTRWLLG